MITSIQTDTTEYLGSFQYKNKALLFVHHAEGYIDVKEQQDRNIYNYVYHYTDHLGNNRLSYTDANKDGFIANYRHPKSGKQIKEILEQNHYYPFGLKHQNYNTGIRKYERVNSIPRPIAINKEEQDYKYKYNGKELQDELGLDWYDYGARNYDASLGRWMNVDPLAEETNDAYGYAYNNPINLIDPTGMAPEDIRIRDKDGDLIATYYTTKVDDDVYIKNVDVKENLNINLNDAVSENIKDIDVIGINVGGEFTVGGGATVGFQYAYFLDGKDKFEGAYFYTVQGNLGLSVGAGVTVFAGDYTGSDGDSSMTMNDFLGNIASYNVGIKYFSGSYWWGNNLTKNQPELWPGMGSVYNNNYNQTWSGYSIGATTGVPKLQIGVSIGHGVTKYLKWANKLFNTVPHTKGYQYEK